MTAPSPAAPPLVAADAASARTLGLDLAGRRANLDLLIDAGFSIVLSVVAVFGLRLVYTDSTYLLIGTIGALVGTAAIALAARFRLDPLVTLIVVVLGFLLFSGVATIGQGVTGLVPSPAAFGTLFDGLVNSWANLVTTAPPVGTTAGLGVPPYVLGFTAAAGAMLLARRTQLTLVPVAPPLVAAAVGFVFGTGEPSSLALQGTVVAALCLTWGAVRAHRPRRSADGITAWSRIGSATIMVVAVAAIGAVLGPALPFVDGDDRFNLRQEVVPPFDPRDEASPLAAYRDYLVKDNRDTTLFTVSGLPGGTRVKLATMDTYDGVVWVVGGPQGPTSGRFERVGASILPVPPGESATLRVEVRADRSDVWAPTAGATRSMTFEGDRAALLADSFRYNRDTQSAALPARLAAGDIYTAQVQLPIARDDGANAAAAVDPSAQLPPLPSLPDDIAVGATDLVGGATTPYSQAVALEQLFQQEGYFSDGGEDKRNTVSESAAGHSLFRIQSFLADKTGYVGNGEQYAATMAVVARSLGLPARVVMGFTVPDGGGPVDLRSSEIQAWVEVAFEGLGWVPFSPTPATTRVPPQDPVKEPKKEDLSQQEPPPPTYLKVPETLPDVATRPPDVQPPPEPPADAPFEIPTAVLVGASVVLVPVLLLGALAAIVVGLKWRRRRRRRSRRDPVRRLDGAWLEACDQARDLGADLPARATRREIAGAAAPSLAGVEALADAVDGAMFGPAPLADTTVSAVWATVAADRTATLAALPFAGRVRAAVSLASLRPGRASRVRRVPDPGSAADPMAVDGASATADAGDSSRELERV